MPRYKNLPHVRTVKKKDEFVSAVDRFLHAVSPYRKFLLTGGLLLGVFFIVVLAFRHNREAKYRDFDRIVYEAETKPAQERMAAYQEIIRLKGPSSQIGIVDLKLAQLFMEEGKIEEALKSIKESSRRLPSFLAPLADFSQAQLAWQQGQLEEGIKSLNEIGEPDSLSRLLKAQMLEASGKTLEARKTYEEILLQEEEGNEFSQKIAKARLVQLNLGGNQ